jgi:N utilization substance protein B
LLGNNSLAQSFKKLRTEQLTNNDLVKKIYLSLISCDEYKEYTREKLRDKKSEKKIVEFIFHKLLTTEDFINDVEEKFINWDDDCDMMVILMDDLLQKPFSFNLGDIVSKEKMDFAIDLTECTIDKKSFCLELIKPKLRNWDAERIAALDMILMRMGVCEFLYFETIPPRVTINEYIDLAKEYSTDQSGHFVNGILDNIHKELLKEDKIHKKNFKNSTL